MARNPEINSLLSLLDDEDESVAVNAMAELLNREAELGEALAELQESSHPLLRRRSHQLQAAITLRRRRREFIRKLQAPRVDLIDGLIDVHLQWYDNDSRPELESLWSDFRQEAARCPLHTLEELAYFMRKSGFTAQPETTLRPENYCIGPILENHTGSAALLAAIAGAITPAPFRMVRVMGDFALYDGEGRLLVPAHDWQLCPAPGITNESHRARWGSGMKRFSVRGRFLSSESLCWPMAVVSRATAIAVLSGTGACMVSCGGMAAAMLSAVACKESAGAPPSRAGCIARLSACCRLSARIVPRPDAATLPPHIHKTASRANKRQYVRMEFFNSLCGQTVR